MTLALAFKLIDYALMGLEMTAELKAHRTAVRNRLKRAARGDHITEEQLDESLARLRRRIDNIMTD